MFPSPAISRPAPRSAATPRWWHLFHQVPDLPESLVYGRERLYLEWFYMNGCDQAGAIGDDDIAEYVRTYSQPGAMRAGFNFYRALSRRTSPTIAPPLPPDSNCRCRRWDSAAAVLAAAAIWSSNRCAASPFMRPAAAIPDCGHFIPEEKPVELANHLREFLAK